MLEACFSSDRAKKILYIGQKESNFNLGMNALLKCGMSGVFVNARPMTTLDRLSHFATAVQHSLWVLSPMKSKNHTGPRFGRVIEAPRANRQVTEEESALWL